MQNLTRAGWPAQAEEEGKKIKEQMMMEARKKTLSMLNADPNYY